ncbi:hypothetical protein BF95_03925 [Sphingobium sp. Ant17]|nr:hypothetical protein BF95_03925 [Sphingobium sp. Ant17]
MGRVNVFYQHESSKRDAIWILEQDDDGSLHVRYEDEMDRGETWRKPINEFLAAGGLASHRALMSLVDRMFETPRA